jgi:alpha-1,2-mannosyltransferase
VTARVSSRNLLVAGAGVFVLALGAWLIYAFTHSAIYTEDPVDLHVYFDGGWIVRHMYPYDPHDRYPLYQWQGYSSLNLPFTYTPFAALTFVLASFVPWKVAPDLSVVVNIALLVSAIWFTFRGLDVRNRRVRLGLTLLVAGLTLWMQPVLRTLYLGQVNLFLMALILWDLTRPKGRWWKGIGTGIAAGIKLIPIVFVPYLLVARRFRDAIATMAGFLGTIVIGFIILPRDSSDWWLHGLFVKGSRAGFAGWEGNQSLRGLITRLAGSVNAGSLPWLIVAGVFFVVGVIVAGVLDRAGYPMPAILTASLTGLLTSPISWDHHWVWVAPAVAVLGYYGYQFRETARSRAIACYGSAMALLLSFFAWPAAWFESARYLSKDSLGLIWMSPDTNVIDYFHHGDNPAYPEYHWHGFQLIWGNTYVLVGLAAMIAAVVIALRVRSVAVSSPGTNRSPAGLMESATTPPS